MAGHILAACVARAAWHAHLVCRRCRVEEGSYSTARFLCKRECAFLLYDNMRATYIIAALVRNAYSVEYSKTRAQRDEPEKNM